MKKKIFYGWWIVAATNIICLLGYGTWLYSFGVFFKPMMLEFGWSRAMTAGAYSLRGIEGGLIAPLVGWAVDKYGSRIVIFCGGVISGLGFVLMYTVNSLLSFYLIYGVLLSIGMTAMLYLPAFATLTNWFKRKLSRAMSLLAVGAGIGGFICAPAAAILLSHVGWRMAFVYIGILIWVVVLPLSLVVRHKPEEMGLRPDNDPPDEKSKESEMPASDDSLQSSTEQDWTLKQALSSKTYWILTLAFLFASMAHSIVTVHSIPALTDVGISPEKAAFSLGLVTLMSIIGRLAFGGLGDHVDKRYLFFVAYIFKGLGILVLMDVKTMRDVYLFAALFGIGFGGSIPLGPAIRAQYFGSTAYGKISGFMTPIVMIGSFTGPVLAGYMFDVTGTYRTCFLGTAILVFLAAVTINFARPTKLPAQTVINQTEICSG